MYLNELRNAPYLHMEKDERNWYFKTWGLYILVQTPPPLDNEMYSPASMRQFLTIMNSFCLYFCPLCIYYVAIT
jgi:hypothetical protein